MVAAQRNASARIRSRESDMFPSTLRKETVQWRQATIGYRRRDVYLSHETAGVDIRLVVSSREQTSEIR